MSKSILVAGVLVVFGAAAWVSTRLQAQEPGPFPGGRPFLQLEGLGSSIGISARDADPDEVRKAGSAGVVVQDVLEGTPAARAGLRAGDIVVEFDGEPVRSARQFTRLVRETAPGRPVKIAVMRDGSRQVLDITPESRGAAEFRLPDITADVQRGLRVLPRAFDWSLVQPGAGPFSPRRLGVSVIPLGPQLAEYFGVEQGLLVSEVAPDSPAEGAGIKAGDVIMTINGRAVASPDDVVREMRDAESGSSLDVRVMRDRRELTFAAKVPERRRAGAERGRPI